jgi:hypothetical protein
LKLADTYSVARLEAACEKALAYASVPNFRSIRTILKTGSDRLKHEGAAMGATKNHTEGSEAFAFTRGAVYYGGTHDGE